ncbi:MAG: DegV family protein [Anaerolineales bacterium]|nr:DegV family protein [Anaerolineales bacterium]
MVKIIADTTCGLPHAVLKDNGIPLVPQIVIFGEESYKDDSELDTETFLKKLKASRDLPKTAAPPPPLYHPLFEEARQNSDTLIVVAPSAKVSGTVRSVEVASQDFPEVDIRLVDTRTIAGNLGTMVLLANQWARSGESADTIVSRLQDLAARQRTYFLVNTLEYLQKGGRIGGARALLGEMLQIKPILTVQNGQVESFEQQRTKKRALARLIEIVQEQAPTGLASHLCVMQAEAENEAKALSEELKSRLDIQEIPIYQLPPAIVVHAGPGAMAVGFFATPMV